MKRKPAAFFIGCTLFLTACAGRAASDPVPLSAQPEIQAAEAYEEPEYEVIPLTFSNRVCSEDGKQEELALYNYQLVTLSVQNEEAISPEDAEAADRNKEVFDSKMMAVAEELMEQGDTMAAGAAEVYNEYGALVEAYEDGAAVEAVFCGDIVSASLHRSSYTGGAHPNSYETSYLFDLKAGQFIDPTQLAEDPEAFRAGAAELLIEKAEAHEGLESFWEDYESVIARWNEAGVQFDGLGLTVTWSPYELGPYVLGEIELHLDWEELASLLGQSGLERLGRTETE